MKILAVIFAVLNLAVFEARADSALVVGTPIYAGSGCPKDSVSITFTADGLSFSALFDQLTANLSVSNRRREQRVACQILVPIDLPEGTSLTMANVESRGFAGLPDRGAAHIETTSGFLPGTRFPFWAGLVGKRVKMNLRGPSQDDFTLASDESSHEPQSACGGRIYLHLGEELLLRSPAGQEAELSLDSTDGQVQASVQMQARRCRKSSH